MNPTQNPTPFQDPQPSTAPRVSNTSGNILVLLGSAFIGVILISILFFVLGPMITYGMKIPDWVFYVVYVVMLNFGFQGGFIIREAFRWVDHYKQRIWAGVLVVVPSILIFPMMGFTPAVIFLSIFILAGIIWNWILLLQKNKNLAPGTEAQPSVSKFIIGLALLIVPLVVTVYSAFTEEGLIGTLAFTLPVIIMGIILCFSNRRAIKISN